MKAYAQMIKKKRGSYLCIQLINEKGETIQQVRNFLTTPKDMPCSKNTSVFDEDNSVIYTEE